MAWSSSYSSYYFFKRAFKLVTLEKATEIDAAVLFQMQIDSFSPLLNKYKDYETNPANESIEKTILRINNPSNNFYKMIIDSNLVGAICISQKERPYKFWISPIFITKKKGKAFEIRFTFLCYFRLNIQKQRIFFRNTRVSNFDNE